jgi:L-lactate dehydrogenase complex protein LldF
VKAPPPKPFPEAAREGLDDGQLRRNLQLAVGGMRGRRQALLDRTPQWEELREAAARSRERTLRELPRHLERLEETVTVAGGVVHWARDGEEAGRIVADLVASHGAGEAIKVKSLVSDEIDLNDRLAARGIQVWETDMAEMILQLAGDYPSHIGVPSLHLNRSQIRNVFADKLDLPDLGDDPKELCAVARDVLRQRFLSAGVGISGANFAVAETGSVCIVESEGNGRMCTTLPEVLISITGIEKVLPTWSDLSLMLQMLPRSAAAEEMSPYVTCWTGVDASDGPREFHLVLLDGGRTETLADEVGREALRCIRCSACLNACPVYQRTGGHAYRSVYPGPIGAILTPQLAGLDAAATLPSASTLCGACYEVCPVKIDIPSLLVRLRGRVVRETRANRSPEALAMRAAARVLGSRRRYEGAQRAARKGQRPFVHDGTIERLPGPLRAWTRFRDLRPLPPQTFREWWSQREEQVDDGA